MAFRRVSETEQLPDIMSRAILGERQTIQNDPYAALRAEEAQRRQAIARQSVENRRQAHVEDEYDWNAQNQPSRFEQRRTLARPGDNLRDIHAADMDGRAIRRTSMETDNGENMRNIASNFNFVTSMDAYNLLDAGFSIWSPEYDGVREAMASLADDKGMYREHNSDDEKAIKHAEWERSKSKEANQLRPRTRIAERAPVVLRTSMENVSDSRFGQVDYAALDRAETERQRRLEESRESRLSIKDNHILGKAERHRRWELGVGEQTRRTQDYRSEWADGFADRYDR